MLQQTRLDLQKKNGDLKFEGEIIGYDVQPIAIQGDETSALNRLTMTVKVRYTNTFDREKDFVLNFSRFADYQSSNDLASVEETLIQEINDQLTQDIFDRSPGETAVALVRLEDNLDLDAGLDGFAVSAVHSG